MTDERTPLHRGVATHNVTIFIAGDYNAAKALCRDHCGKVGLCVTVTPTSYVYTGGEEAGVIIGLIHYPRFPSSPAMLWDKAFSLALMLREGLGQESFTIQDHENTEWFSWRKGDANASPSASTGEEA